MKKIEENLQVFKTALKTKEKTHKEVSPQLVSLKEDFQRLLTQQKDPNPDNSFNETKLHISTLFFYYFFDKMHILNKIPKGFRN